MREIKYIPFEHTDKQLREEYEKAFREFLDRKWYILGEKVQSFESEWASYCETKYSVGVGNGYDALFLSLKALDIGENDEVIVPAHTFAATAIAVMNVGAKPVLVDADPSDFTMDMKQVEKKVNAKTRAIIAVHIYGTPCDMDRLQASCDQYNLFLIEDNAQSHGARYKGKRTGSFGKISATSFYPVKNLGALGDGGAVNTNDEQLIEKLKLLRSYGSPDKHAFEYAGVNSRLDELQATFLSIKLKYLDRWNEERRQLAEIYRDALLGMSETQLAQFNNDKESVYHIFPILTDRREALRVYLKDNGIHTLRHYPQPYYLEKAFSELKYKTGDFPVAEMICDRELSLPLFPGMKREEVEYVAEKIKSFFRK